MPTKDDFEKIVTNIVFATIVEITEKDINKDEVEKIVLVDVPSKVYNELRQIFISLFESSGFKDVKINENVDFQKLYSARIIQ